MTVSISKCIFRYVPGSLCKDNVQNLTHFNSLKTQILRKLFGFRHDTFALENIPSDFIPDCFLPNWSFIFKAAIIGYVGI